MIFVDWFGIVVINACVSATVSFFMQRYFFHKHQDKIDQVEIETKAILRTVKEKVSEVVNFEEESKSNK